MGTRHVTDLLSAAYDGALSPAEQRRYDEHLATCADCAGSAEQFRQAIDAVHALPRARMPQRVVLPATPPQPERRRRTAPAWLQRIPRPTLTPAWGAGTLAAVGIIAAVLAVHGHLGGSNSLSAGSAPQERALFGGGNQGATGANGTAQQASIGTCPLPLAVVPQPANLPTQPQGFTHAAVTTVPQRPGEKLVLATTTTKVSAGEQVLIYAALTTSGGQQHSAVIPCVSLHGEGALAYGGPAAVGGAGAAGSAAGQQAASTGATPAAGGSAVPQGEAVEPGLGMSAPKPVEANPVYSTTKGTTLTPQQVEAFAPYSLIPPLAVASPTSAAVATLPLQVLQIPRDTLPGTVLQLVALVPSGLPSGGDQPAVEAVLTLEVS